MGEILRGDSQEGFHPHSKGIRQKSFNSSPERVMFLFNTMIVTNYFLITVIQFLFVHISISYISGIWLPNSTQMDTFKSHILLVKICYNSGIRYEYSIFKNNRSALWKKIFFSNFDQVMVKNRILKVPNFSVFYKCIGYFVHNTVPDVWIIV